MKRHLLTLVIILASIAGSAQTYTTLPAGYSIYGSNYYKNAAGSVLVGTAAGKFRVVSQQQVLDSLISVVRDSTFRKNLNLSDVLDKKMARDNIGVTTYVDTTLANAIANPYDTQGKLFHFYKKLLNGSVFNSNALSRSAVKIKLGSLFDSVAGYGFIPIANKFTYMFGANGGIIPMTSTTGGGYTHADTNDTQYWFNGTWYGINSAGSLRYLLGGGLTASSQIKVYYITEPGAGSFKVQISSTSTTTGYADVGSVVNCNGALGAGVFTYDTALASYATQVVQVSGNVKIIMVAQTNTDPNTDGVALYNMAVGGLNLDNVTTSSSILNPVFTDLGIDLMFWEAKENPTAMAAQGYSFFDSWRTNSPNTDWVLMGSSPQTEGTGNNNNIASNKLLKSYAASHRWLYYDGYTPLISIQEMRNLGWLGSGDDELHLSISTGVYRAAQIWRILGIDGLLNLGNQFGATISKEPVLQNGQGIHWTDSFGAFKGRIKPIGSDQTYDAARWHIFRLMSGTVLGTLKQSVGWEMPTGSSYRFADGNRLESVSSLMTLRQSVGNALTTLTLADGTTATQALTKGQFDAGQALKQDIISVTTIGTTGPATKVGNVINIPQYAGGSGTVTSVALTAPTGLQVSGSPITSAGTFALTFQSGYSIPTTANQTNWSIAYGWGDHSLAGYATASNVMTFTNKIWNGAAIADAYVASAAAWNAKQAALSGTGIVKSTAGTISYLTDNSSNWNTAYGWGDHSLAGYSTASNVMTFTNKVWNGTAIADAYIASASNWNTAYGWGNHASAGYVTTGATNQNITGFKTFVNGILLASSAPYAGLGNIGYSSTDGVGFGDYYGAFYIKSNDPGLTHKYIMPAADGTLATTADVTAAAGAGGTYTPTLSAGTNISSVTARLVHYSKSGDQVTLSGYFDCSTSGSGNSVVYISLPPAFPSNLGADADLSGTCVPTVSLGSAGYVMAYSTGDQALVQFNAVGATSGTVRFTCMYTIIP